MKAAAAGTGPALEARACSIAFGGLRAVQDFNLRLDAGELCGLIGPNGAGKTTIFNLLTGVYQPDSGDISLFGETVTALAPWARAARGLTRTFQNIRLFKELTALENVLVARNLGARHGIGAAVLGTPGFHREEAAMREDALALLAELGLDHRAGERSGSLPYGEQRRLEIARALATGAKVLLLDEPAAGMNESETTDLMERIGRLRKARGLTILLIDHKMRLVMGICERITVLDQGQTIAVGKPEAIQKDPKVLAAYLGAEDNGGGASGSSTSSGRGGGGGGSGSGASGGTGAPAAGKA
ncbi:MAG TPA: ABC transporter ATP-binding protein [Myxococcota bacterium]|jgi:branched-chain amino acid transport system ATP-binding protein|nr:ABC transporter ATP-binding protein [Myxococcota bacterium]